MAVKRIEHIDVWRFFAVMLVIMEHFLLFSGVGEYWSQVETYSLQIERFGELGVLIFFSISGFVICTALNSEKNSSGRICLKAFYTRRFFRIIPPLWLYLMFLLMLNAFNLVTVNGVQVLTSAAFLCNLSFFESNCPWYVGHTWSLAYEEQVYLFYPVVFLWAWRGGKILRIFIVMITLISISSLFSYYGQNFWAAYFLYFVFLLMGCFTALLPTNWMFRLRTLPFLFWLATVFLLISLICFANGSRDDVFLRLSYPILILIIVFGTPIQFSVVKRVFENRCLSYLGRISYSVYLWQQLATAYYPNTMWWQTLIYLSLVFGFAALSFQYFELPCQRLGTKFSNQLKYKKITNMKAV